MQYVKIPEEEYEQLLEDQKLLYEVAETMGFEVNE